MKVVRAFALVLVAALALASCSTLAQGAVSGALGAVTGGLGGGASSGGMTATGSAAVVVDFQSGEILSSSDARSMMDSSFYVSKVLTPASAATKNQAEVVFISDGSKMWVNHVVGSRKATKADFSIGATVFFLAGWANHDKISSDSYRKDRWDLGNITSVEYLYKNQVEIGGDLYYIDYIRVPTDPIK
ncbi:MAG: hypothetical protein JNG85_09875 [Spirochaetaceae bacterium]|nr:hypothetical protein [Spirochaetaceae bacterium]